MDILPRPVDRNKPPSLLCSRRLVVSVALAASLLLCALCALFWRTLPVTHVLSSPLHPPVHIHVGYSLPSPPLLLR